MILTVSKMLIKLVIILVKKMLYSHQRYNGFETDESRDYYFFYIYFPIIIFL